MAFTASYFADGALVVPPMEIEAHASVMSHRKAMEGLVAYVVVVLYILIIFDIFHDCVMLYCTAWHGAHRIQ